MNKNIVAIGREMIMFGTIDNYSIEDIIAVLQHADTLYFNGHLSFLSDGEYDTIREYVKLTDPTNAYFNTIGAAVLNRKVKLPCPMGSLDQLHFGDVDGWVTTNRLMAELLVATDKLDGISALLVYESGTFKTAYSRGNGIEGQDITHHVANLAIPKHVPDNKIKRIRGELIISKSNWDQMKGLVKTKGGIEYKNRRNCIAGLMNTQTPHPAQAYTLIDFVAYDIV